MHDWDPTRGSLTRQHWAYTQQLAASDLADAPADAAPATTAGGAQSQVSQAIVAAASGGAHDAGVVTLPDGRRVPASSLVRTCGIGMVAAGLTGAFAARFGVVRTLAGVAAGYLLLTALSDRSEDAS